MAAAVPPIMKSTQNWFFDPEPPLEDPCAIFVGQCQRENKRNGFVSSVPNDGQDPESTGQVIDRYGTRWQEEQQRSHAKQTHTRCVAALFFAAINFVRGSAKLRNCDRHLVSACACPARGGNSSSKQASKMMRGMRGRGQAAENGRTKRK